MGWPPQQLTRATASLDCSNLKACEAAAVLHLDAAARHLDAGYPAEARAQIAAGQTLVRSVAPVPGRAPSTIGQHALEWCLAAGHLQQAYAEHAGAFLAYSAALLFHPGDAAATLGRASAVEAAVLPDGFGGVRISEPDLLSVLGYDPGQPVASGLQQRVSDPASPDHLRALAYLTREYGAVLAVDPSRSEARLRLGRVLAAGGKRDEALAAFREVLRASRDRFEGSLAQLCIGRLAATPEEAVESYRAAAAADPNLRPAWLGLSEALWRAGDREGALSAVERAMEGDSEDEINAWVEYHLGQGRAFRAALDALRQRVTSQ
jgi:tetratricopeptide (TPR) repeat protein